MLQSVESHDACYCFTADRAGSFCELKAFIAKCFMAAWHKDCVNLFLPAYHTHFLLLGLLGLQANHACGDLRHIKMIFVTIADRSTCHRVGRRNEVLPEDVYIAWILHAVDHRL
jgi:hypothetical protein